MEPKGRVSISTPQGAAVLLLGTAIGLFVLKVVVGLATGSISIWAQAVDSSLDIFAVVVTFLTVGFSAKPADEDHPFGHGKIEDIAAGIQALLLLGASAAIAYSAIRRILSGEQIKLEEAGIAVMALSMVVSIFLSRHLFRVSKATGSVALEANADNIRGDAYSTGGVLVGLVLVRFTHLNIIDPIIALAVVVLILRATYRVGRMAYSGLLDVRLPKSEEDIIASAIMEHTGQVPGFHEMRTRKAGNQRFIDLHLMLPKNISVEEAHKICDHLEGDLKTKLPNINVTIHVEPCDNPECEQCKVAECSEHEADGSRKG
ncbi:MAG: cation diffusion facilitator family transporter [Dehalococcoidales bacterium]|nr:cation diffusion facilitator family transporter [Dehalococcoidales bacterium]